MKKRKFGIVIVALILIVMGFCLFFGGIVAVGGVAAAKEALFQHENILRRDFHFEIDEDGIDFEFDFDENGIDFNIDDERIDFDFSI